jgi:glucose/arabinose dehydrogenase
MKRAFAALSILVALGTPARGAQIDLQPAFPNFPAWDQPLDIQDPMDGTDRLFVAERPGRIYVFQNDPAVAVRSLFLDIADSVTATWESGLLGLAFHPSYETNGEFFVVYVTRPPLRTVLARFHVDPGNPNAGDRSTEERLLVVAQTNLYHKGGCVAFGPDGYLYVGLGDDGWGLSQDRSKLPGQLLRIDVNSTDPPLPYAIPPDNPFVGNLQGWREEIYAFGFRNPWRFSFDSLTGRLWLGDVGNDEWEEIDLVRKGRNYGWIKMEGPECFLPPESDTTGRNIDMPIWSYPHDPLAIGASVTAGHVYRGSAMPNMVGRLIIGDYMTGQIWALYDGVSPPYVQEIYYKPPLRRFASFGVDKDNEMYVASFDGVIYRLVALPTGVDGVRSPAAMIAARPNPFGAKTALTFSLPCRARVSLDIYDVTGRRVRTLFGAFREAGTHTVTWDGTTGAGRRLPSGVYFARLSVGERVVAGSRLVLVE